MPWTGKLCSQHSIKFVPDVLQKNRNKMKNLILLVGLFFSNFLFADGPPFDTTGKIRSKYIAIKLEANQINHLQVCRWLKLTSAQQKRLHFLNLPKYISIVDPFYNDCTCGMVYAMWFRVDSIAFEIRDTTKIVQYQKDDDICTWYGKDFNTSYEKNEIYIGSSGQLFYLGKLIDPDEVELIIKNYVPGEGGDKYFSFFLPPISKNPNAKIVLRVKNKLKSIKVDKCSIYWS